MFFEPLVTQVHVWRFRVEEPKITLPCDELVERLGEEEVRVLSAIHVDARKTRRTEVAQGVVASVRAFAVFVVLIKVSQRINLYFVPVSVLVNGPCFYFRRNVFHLFLVVEG